MVVASSVLRKIENNTRITELYRYYGSDILIPFIPYLQRLNYNPRKMYGILFNIKRFKIDKCTTTKATTLSFEKCYHKSIMWKLWNL